MTVMCLLVLVLPSSVAMAEEVDMDVARAQMEEHIRSFGMSDAILAQMKRKGRTDDELEADLNRANSSLADCIVNAVVTQAQNQELPATPVLRMMSGVYRGPEDVEDVSEIDVIQTFDFDAMEGDKQACYQKYMAEIDAQVASAEE